MAQRNMGIRALGLLLSCGLALACADGGACRDDTEQIDAALQNAIEQGVLLGTASACELTRDSFDARVRPSDVDYLLDAFANACAKRAKDCGDPVLPPPPPVSRTAPANGPLAAH